MDNSDPLVWYGTVLIIAVGALMLIPYLRRRADLPTAWNFILLGVIIFTGVGCYEVKYGDFSWPMLQWFQPTRGEVNWYMLGSTVFVVALIVSYYFEPLSRSIASRVFLKWPRITPQVCIFVLFLCMLEVALSLLGGRIFFFGLVLMQLSHKALVFATVFAFVLWYQNRSNPFYIAVFGAVFLSACVMSMYLVSGRRLLLSVFLAPVLCIYWYQARYWRPTRCALLLGCAAMAIFIVSLGYSSIRHARGGQERSVRSMIGEVATLKDRPWIERFLSNRLHYFAQWSSHYSLLTKRYVDNEQLTAKPFNSLRFILAYPIPRSIWPSKPEAVGVIIVRDIVGYRTTNWGVGVAGHGAYEGGVPALIVYAVLLALLARLFDMPMRAQPANPFLIAMLAAAGPHVLSIPRGDLGNMTLESIECLLFAFGLGIICRLAFGTDRSAVTARVAPRRMPLGYPAPMR